MLNLCGFPASFALPEAGGAQVGDSFDFGSLLQKKWEARYQQTTGFRFLPLRGQKNGSLSFLSYMIFL